MEGGKLMKLTIITHVRTNHFLDEFFKEKITALWKEASARIPDRDRIVYGVYCDYESNYKGDYTLIIAIEDGGRAPLLEIPANTKYKIFNVDTSDEQGIINTWKKIWEREEAGTLKRAYTYDFEKYYPDGRVEIHIATK